ncbi:hypothetical protein GDO78_021909 [Eleutherodactylus coqui]|uniref:Uncharacterized protein n=1 Tax=Eleutherodactylus coqui TaxID=57060 RepID=A0A8J6EBN5_ELECQ|nr:hypothetical protein GDO78_021909 [Eleutherodactylus coqui]
MEVLKGLSRVRKTLLLSLKKCPPSCPWVVLKREPFMTLEPYKLRHGTQKIWERGVWEVVFHARSVPCMHTA